MSLIPISSDIEDTIAIVSTEVIDLLDALRPYFPIAIAGLIVWSLWLYRFVLSRKARPIVSDFASTTSVVVPSFHEDPQILMRCLES